jgi:hypothetical protein
MLSARLFVPPVKTFLYYFGRLLLITLLKLSIQVKTVIEMAIASFLGSEALGFADMQFLLSCTYETIFTEGSLEIL